RLLRGPTTTIICPPSLHDALPISAVRQGRCLEEGLRRAAKFEGRGALFGLAGRWRRRHRQLARLEGREPGRALEQSADHRHHGRSEEHTSELQSQSNLVCRLLLEK